MAGEFPKGAYPIGDSRARISKYGIVDRFSPERELDLCPFYPFRLFVLSTRREHSLKLSYGLNRRRFRPDQTAALQYDART
jgi:hypothetical protein